MNLPCGDRGLNYDPGGKNSPSAPSNRSQEVTKESQVGVCGDVDHSAVCDHWGRKPYFFSTLQQTVTIKRSHDMGTGICKGTESIHTIHYSTKDRPNFPEHLKGEPNYKCQW